MWCVYHMCQMSGGYVDPLETEVAGGFEWTGIGAGNWTVLGKRSKCSEHWYHFSSLVSIWDYEVVNRFCTKSSLPGQPLPFQQRSGQGAFLTGNMNRLGFHGQESLHFLCTYLKLSIMFSKPSEIFHRTHDQWLQKTAFL